MKDYNNLFSIKFEKDKLEDTLQHFNKVEIGLVFYDEPEFKQLHIAKQKVWDMWSKLKEELEEEKKKFTKEELKELYRIYNEKYRK